MFLLATSLSVIYASLDLALHQNWLYEYNSWFGKFGILCTTDQANVFFVQLFFPKSLSSYIRLLSLFIIYDSYFTLSLALEQALRGAPSHYVSGIWILLSCLSFPPISANVNKHWKARVKGNDVITNVISANKHFASTFSIQMFKFQRRSCNWVLLPFPAPLP